VSVATRQAPAPGTAARPLDPRLEPVRWQIPPQRAARRRALLVAMLCLALSVWYLAWLLQGKRVGEPVLFGLLVVAEAFNLAQAIGFWWTCSRQRLRGGRPATDPGARIDVLVPVYNEPVGIVEPTIEAASAMRGAEVTVWLLDDGRRAEMEALAERHDARYVTRPERRGAKAGNLNHALGLTDAPLVAIFDCDHVPHVDFLERTLGYIEDSGVAFVQTPQYYANTARSPITAAAAAQQRLFFGPIARGKDGMESMFCCGTNVVFLREALEQAGGFPEQSVTEDFELSVRIHERGWRSVYLSEVVASGLGPEDMSSYVSQQQRWARGCLSTIPLVLRSRLPWRTRLQYLLSAGYFLSGWTLLLYMSLPVIRLLFGIQPLAQITADQFLLHFAPYYCGALAAVALAGWGNYTFGAFALSACSFWIHVQATIGAITRRAARFVVTPKLGTAGRQPRAVAPALVAIAVLVGASFFGLLHNLSAATLNNVAFAALHSSVLLLGALPALRLRRSALLAPEPPVPHKQPRRLPTPVFACALGVTLAIPVAVAVLASQHLKAPPGLQVQARTSATRFMDNYVSADGRVIRRDQGGDTVSEGQAYAMLLAVALGDRARFESVWNWTRSHLQLGDKLLAGRWSNGAVADPRPASDADLDAARALVLAGQRFGVSRYREQGAAIARAVLDNETVSAAGQTVLVAGPWARTDPAVVDPSYFSPRAYADLERVDHDARWAMLASSSRSIISRLTSGGRTLPPDWAAISTTTGTVRPIDDPGDPSAGGSGTSGFDAVRVAIRSAESCVAADRRLAAALWPLYRRAPGRGQYALNGTPQVGWTHASSFVAAAAAANAAGDGSATASLLGQADDAHPTYYGDAWAALGRVMLTSSALGTC
jgi:cellulose synthase/poly-beta-1,6-N-acetylglucosamine synthase-like glycosyltransferase